MAVSFDLPREELDFSWAWVNDTGYNLSGGVT